jgi:LacI family transcriptional regulator
MRTLKDLAQAAQCSLSTVSKALNGRPDVNEHTRQRILQLAREHQFIPQIYHGNITRRLSETIGVIFCREHQPLSVNPFYSKVLEGINSELAINNFNLMLHLLPDEDTITLPRMVLNRQIDGVILVGVMKQPFIDRLCKTKLPVVVIDPKIPLDNISQVLIDNEYGAFMATQYLINKGHRHIGFVSGDLERLSFRQRFFGYQKALLFNTIDSHDNWICTGGLEKGYEQVKTLLTSFPKPSAIFAANDINAIYGYKAIQELGYRVGHDISIIGFDDIELGTLYTPSLTTIRIFKKELGASAVRMVLKHLENPEQTPVTILIPTQLVERESVSIFQPS